MLQPIRENFFSTNQEQNLNQSWLVLCEFSRAWHGWRVFPRLARVTRFPALDSGCTFPALDTGLHVFPPLTPGYTFSRAWHVACFYFDFWLVHCFFFFCCDWPEWFGTLLWFYDSHEKTSLFVCLLGNQLERKTEAVFTTDTVQFKSTHNIALHVRFAFWYIYLPSSANQKRQMTKFTVI